ncbi:Protein-methionine-sulfoxide reductase catalytic subunit MsrP [Rubrobacter xylanophilus DSM 9941]|uniref:sulfite oxidase-like oxidoreductase n=1 Tax=Rubrobacter xylanophilus TaxID=49319 RepID=UPI001C64197A|nr:sulfite oxidase-like oxidoreductase [Rubrobacter xylanophilus]QYJ15735.1 Protein-methionine-sulfoxide reductase catalytic subunit MsrP [Rubrobacter xylanophilus DSM 9941]
MKRIEIDTARGRERIPPGQYLVGERWPVLTYGPTPEVELRSWDFRVDGLVENPLRLTWEEWEELPRVEVKADMHCVTSWSRLDNLWGGVQAKHILGLAEPKPEARYVSVFCEGGYTTNLPLEELYEEDALFATHHDGEPLTPEHGWPLRLVVPRLYAWKSAKWVRGMELLAEDRPGFWEENGYHNYGDPWREQRYSFSL